MVYRTLFFMLITTLCLAQTPGKTLVFKVRAPKTECSIICKESYFWLEIINPVQVKVKGARSVRIKVEVEGGKIVSVKDDIYNILFTRPGTAAISVYQVTSFGRVLLATKILPIKNPDVYFCGIKFDSTSKYINLNAPNIYAYSRYYKKQMSVVSFDMHYIGDTIEAAKYRLEPTLMKSDTCIITAGMRKAIRNFQPKYSSLYIYNIICQVPDGSKRILDPIRLNITVDTTDKAKLSLIYSIKRQIIK